MASIRIMPTESAFDEEAARRIIRQIEEKPRSVIGLSTGRTTKHMHQLVAQHYQERPFPVGEVTFFGLDEVVNVPREYAGACYTMLRTEMLDALGVDDSHFLMLPTTSDDFQRDCQLFREALERRGGIDLLMLGLGENGHLGFNQPGTPFGQEAWVTEMDTALEQRIRRETATPADIWLGGVTLGIKDICHAKRIVLVAKGRNKAPIVREMLKGRVTEQVPASVLQLLPQCDFLLDTEAASLL